jgi:hypothetical protein
MPAKFRNACATLRFGDGPAVRPYQREETFNAQHSTPNAQGLARVPFKSRSKFVTIRGSRWGHRAAMSATAAQRRAAAMPAKFRNACAAQRFGDGPAVRPDQREETFNAQHSTPNAQGLTRVRDHFWPPPGRSASCPNSQRTARPQRPAFAPTPPCQEPRCGLGQGGGRGAEDGRLRMEDGTGAPVSDPARSRPAAGSGRVGDRRSGAPACGPRFACENNCAGPAFLVAMRAVASGRRRAEGSRPGQNI